MRTASFVSIIYSVINVKQKQWYVMAVLSNQLAVFVMEVKVKFVGTAKIWKNVSIVTNQYARIAQFFVTPVRVKVADRDIADT